MLNTYGARKYKEATVNDTLSRIRDIFHNSNIAVETIFDHNIYSEIHSCRVELTEKYGSFGANGKGRNRSYSFASGYAELLERIQNDFFANFPRVLQNKLKRNHGFYYYPDEKPLVIDEFRKLPANIIEDLIKTSSDLREKFLIAYYERLYLYGQEGLASVPFYDTKNGKTLYLPENLIKLATGSNGMAAGNTLIEATYQAICELLERYCVSEIFNNKFTPPTVPDEYLSTFKEEYEIIKQIESSGKYKVTVKCFSSKLRLPSIGIIVVDTTKNRYRLNVGADTDFKVALSRCLTEIYQGAKDETWFDSILLNISDCSADFFTDDSPESMLKRGIELSEYIKNGQGLFPKELFGDLPDYEFDPTVYEPLGQYKDEVLRFIKIFHDKGQNVFLRNVSYLGFPTVYVYIPIISSAESRVYAGYSNRNAPKDHFFVCELDKVSRYFFNLDDCNPDELEFFAQTIDIPNPKAKIHELFNVTVKDNSDFKELSAPFLAALIWLKLGMYEKALNSFKTFYNARKDKDTNQYYKTVLKILEMKCTSECSSIHDTLVKENIDENMIVEVVKDLEDKNNMLKKIKLPRCPNCRICPLNSDCLTKGRFRLADKLYSIKRKEKIDQIAWVSLLDN